MPESRWKGCCKQLFVLPYKCCKGCFTKPEINAACYYVIAWNVCMLAIGILSVSLEQSSDVKRDLYGDYSSGESDTRSWLIDNVGYGQIGFGSAGLLAGLVIRCCSEDRRKLGLAAMIVITAVCVGYGTRLSRFWAILSLVWTFDAVGDIIWYWALLNVIGAILMGVACVNHIVLSYLLLKASCCSDGRSRGSGGGRARQGGGGRGGIDWSNNNSYAGGSDSFRGAGGGLRV